MLLQGGLSACWEEEGRETSDQYQVGDSATLRYTHAILTPRSCSSEACPALRPGELKRNRFQIQYRISHSRFQHRRVRHGASLKSMMLYLGSTASARQVQVLETPIRENIVPVLNLFSFRCWL